MLKKDKILLITIRAIFNISDQYEFQNIMSFR